MSDAHRTPTSVDKEIVAKQIGRKPRPFTEVSRRCRYDYPQVILTEPLQRRGEHWEVFPTVFWLTCPLLHRAISSMEAEGDIRRYEEHIETDREFAQQMAAAHEAAAAHRLAQVPEQWRQELEEQRPREAQALTETGIAGMRSTGGVKCLHAHYADYVGRGDNPIGADVHRRLIERGVPPEGTDTCWQFCTVAGNPWKERASDSDDAPGAAHGGSANGAVTGAVEGPASGSSTNAAESTAGRDKR